MLPPVNTCNQYLIDKVILIIALMEMYVGAEHPHIVVNGMMSDEATRLCLCVWLYKGVIDLCSLFIYPIFVFGLNNK